MSAGIAGKDDFSKDLDLTEIESLEKANLSEGRTLPKKVELDIDDMLIDEEPPPEPQVAPLAVEEPKPEPPPTKPVEPPAAEKPAEKPVKKFGQYAHLKLILVAAAGFIVFALLGTGGWLWLTQDKKPLEHSADLEPGDTHAPKVNLGPMDTELAPFVVNIPEPDQEAILQVRMAVTFADPEGKHEFDTRTIYFRDLIFRFIQGQKPTTVKDQATKTNLAQGLTQLLNTSLKHGQVLQVRVIDLSQV